MTRASEAIPVVVVTAGATMTSRPQSRSALSNSNSSTSILPAHNSGASLPPARYSKSSSTNPRGSWSVASLLRRFICGCGVFYIAMVWYSGMMTLSLPASSSSNTNLEHDVIESKASAQLSLQEMIAREGLRVLGSDKELQQQVETQEQRSEPPVNTVRRIRVTEDKASAAPEQLSAPIVPTEAPRSKKALPAVTIATAAPIEPTTAATTAANIESTSATAKSTTPDPVTIPPYEYMEEIQQMLDAKRPVPTVAQAKDDKPFRGMTPKEAFRARLAQGAALSAREATALQAIDFAARLAKKREEEEAAAHSTMSPKDLVAFQEAEAHALTVKHMPRGETKRRRLKCISWRATEGCDPDGKRKPAMDRSCVRFVDPTSSGYCEVEDRDSGERFRVMARQCDSLHPQARFRCFESWDFSNFAVLANNVTQTAMANAQAANDIERALTAPAPTAVTPERNGILIVIYPKLIPSAFAIVRTLRSQNCSLPIEFWYRTDELSLDHPTLQAIEKQYGPVAFRTIEDQRATGFATKISAIQHSHFDNLLFLDADNFPVKNPTYLFELPEFKEQGAVFWPDFWHPEHTIFNIHKNSLLWQLVDMDFVDMFEQESGQLLLNKRRNAVALELMQFYTFHRPNHFDKFRLAHGDKDLFRLAWLKTNTSFHFIQHPPGVAGKLQNETFCGMTMVQRDPQGDVIFLHRNAKKLTGRKFHVDTQEPLAGGGGTLTSAATKVKKAMEAEDPAVWSHMLLFKPMSRRKDFVIDIYEGAPDFPVGQWCYGKRALATPHFNVFEFATQPFADLETQIRAHAVEATEMVRALKLQEAKVKQQLSDRVV